jgi:molybdate transport system substrate-binding protein
MAGPAQAAGDDPPLVVFAAASLKTSLDEVAAQWQHETGQTLRVSYAGTSALTRQIEQGAPADVFISADRDWMDYLEARHLVRQPTPLLGNRLVLIAPRDSSVQLSLAHGALLESTLGDGRLSVANVQSVPAGRYARAALESLGLWQDVAGRLVQSADVRAALRLVARGETPLGVVYATDARAEPLVRIVDTFDESTHPPIVYMVATISDSTNPRADAFVAFLSTDPARAVFEREGFSMLAGTPE